MYKIWVYIPSIDIKYEMFFMNADSIVEARRIKERIELIFKMLDADPNTRVFIYNKEGDTVY